MLIKKIRKWNRLIHRDLGYFFFGVTVIYALSGIALNHRGDWNPNYSVNIKYFSTDLNLEKSENVKTDILTLLDEIADRSDYKKHYYPSKDKLKIFLKGGSSVVVNLKTKKGEAEFITKRFVFFQVNYLHYNPNIWWTYFSDIFSVSLILLAVTGLFIIKGKNGITGRGAWLSIAGIIIPVLFLIFS